MSRVLFNRLKIDRRLTIAIIVAIVIIGLLIFALIKSINSNNQAIIEKEHKENEYSELITIEDDINTINDGVFNIDVKIPHFTNLDDSYNFYINDMIKNRFDYMKVYREFTAGMKGYENLGFNYNVYYDRYNYGKYISIVVNEYAELEGNRPRITKTCYVIDGENSRTANLYDIFVNKKIYKEKILEEINKQAVEKEIVFPGDEGLTTISDFQSFYIKDKKLHIYFEASTVAANSYGELDFEMPFVPENGLFNFN